MGTSSRRLWLKREAPVALLLLTWGVARTTLGAPGAGVIEADVCVYGGTSGGVVAAVEAARLGKRVMIVEPGQHLGGMTAGGLSAVDIGEPRAVGGITREYFTRLVKLYGKTLVWDRPFPREGGGPATGGAYSIEPHQAERVFDEMAREARSRCSSRRAAGVGEEGRGAHCRNCGSKDGTVFRAKMFLDTTYEGDLMAKAGRELHAAAGGQREIRRDLQRNPLQREVPAPHQPPASRAPMAACPAARGCGIATCRWIRIACPAIPRAAYCPWCRRAIRPGRAIRLPACRRIATGFA